jgi:hypothetical protein
MAYRVEVGPQADVQLSKLDPAVGAAIERKIMWLAENAALMIHRRLVGMPDDLAGFAFRESWGIVGRFCETPLYS